MNRHLKHALLIQLGNHLEDTWEFCPKNATPLQDFLLDGTTPVDMQDKATRQFFELVSFSPTDHRYASLSRLRTHVIDVLRDLDADGSAALTEFLAAGDESGEWDHLNRLFRHMTGSALSEIANPLNVLIHANDQGLEGGQCFSADLAVACVSGHKFLVTNTVAIASTLEHLLLLIRDDVLRSSDSYDWLKNKINLSKRSVDSEMPEPTLEPALLTINKNNRRFMQVSVTCAEADGEYEVLWEHIRFSPTRETIKAISAVAPPEVANRIKGRHLENEIGL
jgi:hypothetical protein